MEKINSIYDDPSLYCVLDGDNFVGLYTRDELVEEAEERCRMEWSEYVPENRIIPSVDFDFEEAIEYLKSSYMYTIIKGEEI